LTQVLRGLSQFPDDKLLVGSATSDDAAVYRLNDTTALIQTLDFFTPIVDDPYLFGQIAAANSLSDIYAMGGRPITAMNIVGMPTDALTPETINQILKGGADKVVEAKCSLAGGHSVQNPEPLYGLSVTGLAHPERILSNARAKEGDILVLTKPLGTGIISTAVKRGLPVEELSARATVLMTTLNTPGVALADAGFSRAGTDVTGFGLLGHLAHVCRESALSAEIDASSVPVIDPQVLSLIADGCVPGGTKKNLTTSARYTHFADSVSPDMQLLLADAQTSGGLLVAVAPDQLEEALALLKEEQAPVALPIGTLVKSEENLISVR
jgi:selenide,water dikinase